MKSLNDVLIEFTFENIELVGMDEIEFDIMAKSNQEGIKFAASDIYISYSTDAFGTNVVTNEKIQATKETIIENEIYTLQLTDETSQIVKFLVSAGLEPSELYSLSQIAEKFLHIKLDIQDVLELANLSFDNFLMANQSFFYDEDARDFIGFDRVSVSNTIFPFLAPRIDLISSPSNKFSAGTRLDEDVLTITGVRFGNHNLNDGTFDMGCTQCRVRFKGSDATNNVYAREKDIISWTDQEIRLNVPSATGIGGPYQNSAASGLMRVETPTGNSNQVHIEIPYSVLNFQPSPDITVSAKRFASSRQNPDRIVFNYHQYILNQGKKTEIDRAIERWCNTTNIGWSVSDEVLQDGNIAGLLSGNDGRNTISVQPDAEFNTPGARAFVMITGHFGACGTNGSIIYIRDVDIAINDDDFLSNEADNWYNYILHELGHAHLLYHSINSDGGIESEYIMYYDITNINNIGQSTGNQHRHPIHPNDQLGAETVFSSSTNLLAPCSNVQPIANVGCHGVNDTEEFSILSSEAFVYPNPNSGKEIFLAANFLERLELSISLYAVTGLHLATFEPIESIVGENVITLPLPPNISRGSYIIEVTSPKGSFFVKFIKL